MAILYKTKHTYLSDAIFPAFGTNPGAIQQLNTCSGEQVLIISTPFSLRMRLASLKNWHNPENSSLTRWWITCEWDIWKVKKNRMILYQTCVQRTASQTPSGRGIFVASPWINLTFGRQVALFLACSNMPELYSTPVIWPTKGLKAVA